MRCGVIDVCDNEKKKISASVLQESKKEEKKEKVSFFTTFIFPHFFFVIKVIHEAETTPSVHRKSRTRVRNHPPPSPHQTKEDS